MRRPLAASSALGVVLAFGSITSSLFAQAATTYDVVGKDSTSNSVQSNNCTLTWDPIASNTRTQVLRRGSTHVTYVSGRYLWTCGTATMAADSTEKYDALQEVELIGNVVYTDSIRTLRSNFLTYHEVNDLVDARDEVELVRLVDESRLVGPRVQFLRAVTSVDAQTVATGRPHVTFYPEDQTDEEPFEVDADQAEFAGENEARFYGDVILERTDVRAEADSAYLTREDGWAVLWGTPRIETKEIFLEGDTIRFYSQDQDLKEVNVIGNGFASSDQFEVRSELIDIEVDEEEVKQVWSHGKGFSDALSGDHLLIGDSLHFVMFEKQIDTVFAVGGALAIQGDSAGLASGLRPTQILTEPASVDSVTADSGSVLNPTSQLPSVDTSMTIEVEKPLNELQELTAADSAEMMSEPTDENMAFVERGAAATVAPQPSIDGFTDWVRGDTLIAIFERPDRGSPELITITEDVERPDSVGVIVNDGSGAMVTEETATSVSEGDPSMERLIAIGQARSFYRQIRDSTLTDQLSRNYMMGTRIEVFFRNGEPETVRGENAIGIYLEPEEALAQPPADTVRMVQSSTRSEQQGPGPMNVRETCESAGTSQDGVDETGLRYWAIRANQSSVCIGTVFSKKRDRSQRRGKL